MLTYTVSYYNEKLFQEIEAWPDDLFADYLRIVGLLIEFGVQVRLPYVRSMGKGLFEIRARGKSNIGRAFYCFQQGKRILILHSFIKKSRQTPPKELAIAYRRLLEIHDE